MLAGDFNTWFGFADQAYRETARAFRRRCRRIAARPSVACSASITCSSGCRGDGVPLSNAARIAFGSDHYPLIATIDLDVET